MHVEAGADVVFAQDEAEVARVDADPCCKTHCKAPPPRVVATAAACLAGATEDTPTRPHAHTPPPLIVDDGEVSARNKAPRGFTAILPTGPADGGARRGGSWHRKEGAVPKKARCIVALACKKLHGHV